VLSAVAHNPELVILDEPFSGLDPVNQSVLEELIRELASNGQTVVFSTHVMQHAERLCDHILLITRGKKIFDGTLGEARACIPRRVLLETADATDSIATLDGVSAVQLVAGDNDSSQWQVEISENLNPQEILRHCFDKHISLNRFEFVEPSLHDVFVHLVGDEAKEHVSR